MNDTIFPNPPKGHPSPELLYCLYLCVILYFLSLTLFPALFRSLISHPLCPFELNGLSWHSRLCPLLVSDTLETLFLDLPEAWEFTR